MSKQKRFGLEEAYSEKHAVEVMKLLNK